MDTQKIGSLIYSLRKEKGMTQAELAQQLHITDKTVSKWERGKGAPDVSLLADLSAVFQVDLEKLLAGELEVNQPVIGNMRKLRFYVCPICGNLLFSVDEAAMYCCGKKVNVLKPQKAEEYEKLTVEIIENEYCISSAHAKIALYFIRRICKRRHRYYPEAVSRMGFANAPAVFCARHFAMVLYAPRLVLPNRLILCRKSTQKTARNAALHCGRWLLCYTVGNHRLTEATRTAP